MSVAFTERLRIKLGVYLDLLTYAIVAGIAGYIGFQIGKMVAAVPFVPGMMPGMPYGGGGFGGGSHK